MPTVSRMHKFHILIDYRLFQNTHENNATRTSGVNTSRTRYQFVPLA